MRSKRFKTNRIEAISDGVFAIAMTLLVLELKLPELDASVSRKEFADAILGQGPQVISWLISFAILCRLWLSQHALLDRNEKKSRGFTTLNFMFLGAISFIPFPTSLISEHSEQPLSVIIFSATVLFAGLSLGAMWLLLDKEGEFSDSKPGADRTVKRLIIWIMSVAIISCLVTIIDSRLGILAWAVIPFAGFMVRTRGEKKNETPKI